VTYLRQLYDGDIRSCDEQFGVLIQELERDGMLDRTIVIVMADHGEEFLEHGSFRKGGGLVDVPDARIVRKKGKYPLRAAYRPIFGRYVVAAASSCDRTTCRSPWQSAQRAAPRARRSRARCAGSAARRSR